MVIDVKRLGSSTVIDEKGIHVPVANFWKNGPAVLIFLRHFGCIACRAHAIQLWGERKKFQSKGAKLIFISNGLPGMISAFKEDLKIDGPVYTDPGLAVYQMCGFKRTVWGTIGLKTVKTRLELKRQGFEQKGIHGDIWQQGGVLAVNPQGKILFHFISRYLGDFPEGVEMEKASTQSE